MPDIYVAPGRKKHLKKKPFPEFIRVAERLAGERQKKAWGAFSILPRRVRFETQEEEEEIILLLRQHWVTQVRWWLVVFLGIFLPLLLYWVPILDFLPGRYQFMAVVIWYLLLIAFIFERFIGWFFHVFIITDERVIDVDFINLLYKKVSEAKIDNIQDVTYKHGGTLATWFNYGDVSMQTAGEQREFMIGGVPQPSRVAKILNELRLEEEEEKIEGRVR
jgi:uncharacterized membrane protein YdbT with pleckstrin-like domain